MRARAAVAALACLSLAACGEKDEEKRSAPSGDPAKVVAAYYAATQDVPKRCSLLSGKNLDQYGGRAGCETRVIASTFPPDPITVERTVVGKDTACVRFKPDNGGQGIVVLVPEGRVWRIDSFDSGIEPGRPETRPCGGTSDRKRD